MQQPIQLILAALGGAVSLSLIEYLHHRVGGHTVHLGERLKEAHQAHHRDPQEGGVALRTKYRQRLPLVTVVGAVVAATSWLVFNGPIAMAVLAGSMLGYLYSEGYHHHMHHRAPRTLIGAWLRRYHYVHHFVNPKVNYGFTSPVWDVVFGTYKAADIVTLPSDRVPADLDPGMGFVLRERRSR
jgi:sterol desaturase/sphingolipid hydroxylase (fatty acid hydroxylase superfamily)